MRALRFTSFFSVLFILCVQLSCAQDAKSIAAQKAADDQKLQEYFTKHHITPIKAAGIYYTVSKEGTGNKILAGSTVTIDYTGKFLDGTPFDSNTDPKFQYMDPLIFEVGVGKVIPGWDKGIQQLKKGSVATLYIPSGMGYGPRGSSRIPANSILVFDIAITDVTK